MSFNSAICFWAFDSVVWAFFDVVSAVWVDLVVCFTSVIFVASVASVALGFGFLSVVGAVDIAGAVDAEGIVGAVGVAVGVVAFACIVGLVGTFGIVCTVGLDASSSIPIFKKPHFKNQ